VAPFPLRSLTSVSVQAKAGMGSSAGGHETNFDLMTSADAAYTTFARETFKLQSSWWPIASAREVVLATCMKCPRSQWGQISSRSSRLEKPRRILGAEAG
jgi:hypothetical protein